jgi:flagellar biosynthesis GTPase FlhF
MAVQTTCPSCQTKLVMPSGIGPNAKIKCPKCGQVCVLGTKTVASERQTPAVDEKPPLARSSSAASSFLSILLPACSIIAAILSLALPIYLGQYVLGLVVACLALVGAIVGLILLLVKKWRGIPTHLAALAISVAGVLLAVNALLLRTGIERHEELRTNNEQAAAKAKADLDDAARKLAAADEAFRKADEAPKKAAAFYAMAKDAQDKANAAEKRTAELLAKAEDVERKNNLERKKIAEEIAQAELAQKNLKTLQKNLDQTEKMIEDKKQEIVALKKKIDADKKRAEADLAALKTEIDADKKRAEEKQKETKEILKTVEEFLKGAALNLKNKDASVRIKTANRLAKLPAFPEAKETVGEALVEALFDPVAGVRNAASTALEKIDPVVHPHIMTVVSGQDKFSALIELERLGKAAKSALPVFIRYQKSSPSQQLAITNNMFAGFFLNSLAKIGPDDKRVVQIVLNEVEKKEFRLVAIPLLDTVNIGRKDKVKALLSALKDGERALFVIDAIERIQPAAIEAMPALKQLTLSPDEAVRNAAASALAKIEASK